MSNQSKKDNKDIDTDEPPRISVEFWSAHVALTSQWLKAQALLEHIGEFMPSTEWLEEEIRSILPNSDVEAIDLNGTQDHFHIRIIDESFSSMRPLQRQKLILNHFKVNKIILLMINIVEMYIYIIFITFFEKNGNVIICFNK